MKYIFVSTLLFSFITLFFNSAVVSAHSSIVIIKMTSSGFVPNEVTIDEETTLNFVNEDGVDHWPASDLHPTHEVFPEFDPKRPIPKGDVWLFKPKKVGVWKFHDHLFPHQKGVLTVKGEADSQTKPTQPPIPKTFLQMIWSYVANFFNKTFLYIVAGLGKTAGIKSTPTTSAEISGDAFKKLPAEKQFEQLKSLAKEKGSQGAWQFVLATYQGESGTLGSIHDVAHLSGQLLFEEKGFTGLSLCTAQFGFGCFHGFLDSAFKDSLEKLPDAELACRQLGSGMIGPVASCIHGIGHGVASFYETTKLQDALSSCNRLSPEARQYCYDGVFMEFERNAAVSFYHADDPLYPCNTLSAEYVFSCGRNQPQVLLQRFKKSFGEVASVCIGATNPDFKKSCTDALGFIAAAQGQGMFQQIVGLCQQVPDTTYSNQCLQSAAGEVVFQEMPQWHETAPSLCMALDVDLQKDCFSYINRLISEYGRVRPQTKGEDPHTYIQSQMRICWDSGARDGCYKKVAQFFSDQFGLKQSLALLAADESVPAVYARCHELTHYLSRAEYDKTKSVPQTYAQCDSTCHGGCYHGTLEAFLKEKQITLSNDAGVKDALRTVCGKPSDHPSLLIFYECMHGLGHAAMFITDMELISSLRLCDELGEVDNKERCYSGAFMENSSSSTNNDHPGKYVKKEDPMYPCNSLEERYQQLCYRYQSSYFALISNHRWGDVARLCLQVPGKYQTDCFRTIGTNQVGFTTDMVVMKANCEALPDQFKDTCFAGVIGSMSYRFVGSIDKMKEFCGLLDSGNQQNCFRNIGTSIVDWTSDRETREQWCNQSGKGEFVAWCKEGLATTRRPNMQVFN